MLLPAVLKNIATLGFIGYLPLAPGTFASLAAFLFFLSLKPSFPAQVSLLIVFVIAGTAAADCAEKILGEKDSRHIVIDEFAGYMLSVLFLPRTIPCFFAAFLLFRFFDILKPPPIKWIEKNLPGGVAIVADDLMAGIYVNALLRLWILLA